MGEERERIEDEAPEETPEESPRDEAPASTDEAARGVEEDARISRAVSFGLEPGELEARREALLAGEPLRLGVLRRGLVTDSISTIDPDKRTVELTWSSERAVERWFGTEILDHSPESVDLARLKAGGPVLLNHNPEKQVGVVEDVSIGTDRRGRATIRFGRSALASEVFDDVQDGIRRNVSTGYRIHKLRRDAAENAGARGATQAAGAGGKRLRLRGVSWEPLELSVMSVAEDYTVGIGRGADDDEQIVEIEGLETRAGDQTAGETVVESEPEEDSESMGEEIQAKLDETRQAERDRISAILAAGEKFGQTDLARTFVEEDRSVADFNAAVLEAIGKDSEAETVTRGAPDAETQDNAAYLGLEEKQLRNYSLFRGIQAQLDGDWSKAGLEREASDLIADRLDRGAKGFFVPNDVLVDPQYLTRTLTRGAYLELQRVLDVTDTASAEPLRGTAHLAGSFIELLRNRTVALQAGARVMDGLVGDVDIPRQTGGATAAWVAEGGVPSLTDPTFETVTLAPQTVGAATSMTRRALKQSQPSVEALVREDINRVIGIAIDVAALRGTGHTNNQPPGVVGSTGVGDVEFGANGAAATWPKIVEFVTDVADANADLGSLGWVFTPKGRGHLQSTAKEAGQATYMWSDDNTVAGYRALVTKNLRDDRTQGSGTNLSEVLFGNWADLVIALWGAFDLVVDTATLVTSNGLVLRAFQDLDCAVRHGASFSYSDDLNTA